MSELNEIEKLKCIPTPLMSIFRGGCCSSNMVMQVSQIYNLITGSELIGLTKYYREITKKPREKARMPLNRRWIRFSPCGVMRRDDDREPLLRSGLAMITFGHVYDIAATKERLLNNPYRVETLMMYAGRENQVLHWLVVLPEVSRNMPEMYVQSQLQWLWDDFSLKPEGCYKDPMRTYHLAWDPDAYLDVKLLNSLAHKQIKIGDFINQES